VKENGTEYMDLYGRALVDIAVDLINGYLLCGHASTKVNNENSKLHKAALARIYISKNAAKIAPLAELICSGDKSAFSDYDILVGPVLAE
jgi:hypothetical protein